MKRAGVNLLQLPEEDHEDGCKEYEDKITGTFVALVFLGHVIHFPPLHLLHNVEQESDPFTFSFEDLEIRLKSMFGGHEIDHLFAQVHIGRFRYH